MWIIVFICFYDFVMTNSLFFIELTKDIFFVHKGLMLYLCLIGFYGNVDILKIFDWGPLWGTSTGFSHWNILWLLYEQFGQIISTGLWGHLPFDHEQLTSDRCRWIALIHVGIWGRRRCFSGVQCNDLAPFLEVKCHKESSPDAHAMWVENPIAEKSGDCCVHCCATSLQHIPKWSHRA